MIKHFLFPFVFLFYLGLADGSAQSKAQSENDTSGKTSLFLELGGSGWIYSVNLDHKIYPFLSVRGGLTAVPARDFGFVGGPVLINALPGWNAHRMEVGVGTLLGYFSSNFIKPGLDDTNQSDDSGIIAFLALNTGYRYQPMNRKIFFRAAYTPFVTSEGWRHWGGIGIGFTLSK